MPALHGTTFVGDHCGGWVRSFVWTEAGIGAVTEHPELQAPAIGGWGVDAAGEIYVTDVEGGTVKRLAAR